MRKARKGFTTVELVITLALIGVLSAMSAVTIAAMVNIQGNAGQTASVTEQVDAASRKIAETVSFISVKNAVCDFEVSACEDEQITFENRANSTEYCPGFAGTALNLTTNYAGSDPYLNYSYSEKYTSIKSIVFSYDLTLSLMKVVINPSSGSATTRMYSLEVLR